MLVNEIIRALQGFGKIVVIFGFIIVELFWISVTFLIL